MLTSLHIQNVVLIEAIHLDWQQGLSALTGETGAGKSILLDAVSLAVGARSESSLLRAGADQALVTAGFQLPETHPVWAYLAEQDVTANWQEDLLLRRSLGRDGRSKAYINDQPVQVGTLREVGDLLLEIHGQFATHALLRTATHRNTLDRYAGQLDQAAQLASNWQAWQETRRAHETLVRDADRLGKEADYLRAAVDELTTLAPLPGEEEQLLDRKNALRARAGLMEALDQTLQSLQSEDGGARPSLLQGYRTLSRQQDKGGAEWAEATDHFDKILGEVQELEVRLERLLSALNEGGFDLETVEDRLYTLRAIARKHGCQVDDLAEKANEMAAQLNVIDNLDTAIARAAKAESDAKAAYIAQGALVSAGRKRAAQTLEQLVGAELPPLKLDKARFVVQLTPLSEQDWGPSGCEDVAFLLATHNDAAPAPLAKVASGGELSRLMLAIKLVLADTSPATTLIFDEVDTGIGGATAAAVGERLARLARQRQVLVITHAPQVAAQASQHMVVAKDAASGRMTTSVTTLTGDTERREEIARMLAGSEVTEQARAAAQSLLAGRAA